MQQIAAYIAVDLCAPVSAKRLMEKLRDAFRRACGFPNSLPSVNDDFFRSKGYRKMIVDNYVAFVLIDEKNETISVVRVLYYAQDYQKIL